MKNFLGLPIRENARVFALMKHYMEIILFTGVNYFLLAIVFGLLGGDVWMYVQSIEKHYLIQLLIILMSIPLGLLAIRYIVPNSFVIKYDLYFYPLAFLIVFLITNEIWGL